MEQRDLEKLIEEFKENRDLITLRSKLKDIISLSIGLGVELDKDDLKAIDKLCENHYVAGISAGLRYAHGLISELKTKPLDKPET